MARRIPDFTARERNLISQTLTERFGAPLPLQSIQAEIQLDLLQEELTQCPSITWQEGV